MVNATLVQFFHLVTTPSILLCICLILMLTSYKISHRKMTTVDSDHEPEKIRCVQKTMQWFKIKTLSITIIGVVLCIISYYN